MPQNRVFTPAEPGSGSDSIELSVDEYEAVRLIDFQNFTQEECGAYMKIARTTVQEIYASARRKLAAALVEAKTLIIKGGDYVLCDGREAYCGCGGCPRHRINNDKISKGDNVMRIAVTYENGLVFGHFGHTAQFKLYDVEDGKITSQQVVDTEGSGHGALAGLLRSLKTDVLICGGIGGGAQNALTEAGIKFYGGVTGSADNAVNAFLEGNLGFNPNVHCEHHEHEHACGHNCGEDKHGCQGN